MAHRVTIVGIARELGLSKSTVSDALNGTGRVSNETSVLIRETARRLGYVSNRAARSLRTRRFGNLGLFLPPAASGLAFYMEFALGVSAAAARAGFDLTLLARDPSTEGWAPQIDGAVAVDPTDDEAIVQGLLSMDLPVITVGRYSGAGAEKIRGTLEAKHVDLEHAALEHVYSRGRRVPVLIAVDEALASSWAKDSTAIYQRWCRGRGLEPRVREVRANGAPPEVMAAVVAALDDDGADALVCGGQGIAAQAQLIMEQRGIAPGHAVDLVSLVGAAPTETDNPAMTVVNLQAQAYGRASTAFLLDALEHPGGAVETRWFDGATLRLA